MAPTPSSSTRNQVLGEVVIILRQARKRQPRLMGWFLTFVFINLAWVVFRAPDMGSLRRFAHGFLGWNGFAFRVSFQTRLVETSFPGLSFSFLTLFVLTTLGIALLMPNSKAMLGWQPRKKLWLAAGLSVFAIINMLSESTPEFIYSNF